MGPGGGGPASGSDPCVSCNLNGGRSVPPFVESIRSQNVRQTRHFMCAPTNEMICGRGGLGVGRGAHSRVRRVVPPCSSCPHWQQPIISFDFGVKSPQSHPGSAGACHLPGIPDSRGRAGEKMKCRKWGLLGLGRSLCRPAPPPPRPHPAPSPPQINHCVHISPPSKKRGCWGDGGERFLIICVGSARWACERVWGSTPQGAWGALRRTNLWMWAAHIAQLSLWVCGCRNFLPLGA